MDRTGTKRPSWILILSLLLTLSLFAGLATVQAAQTSLTITFGTGGNWRTYLDPYTNENAMAIATGTTIDAGDHVGPRTKLKEDKTGKTVFTVDGIDPGIYLDFSSISGGLSLGADYVIHIRYAVVNESFTLVETGKATTFAGTSEAYYWNTSGSLVNQSSDKITMDFDDTISDHYTLVSSAHQTSVGKIRIDIPAASKDIHCKMDVHIEKVYIGPRSGSPIKKLTYSYKNSTAGSASATEYVVSGGKPTSVPSVSATAQATNATVRYPFKGSWTVGSTKGVTTANLKNTAITADTTITAEYYTDYLYHFKKLTAYDTWGTSDLWVRSGQTPAPGTPGTVTNSMGSIRKVFKGWTPTLSAASSSNKDTTYTAEYYTEYAVVYHNYKMTYQSDFTPSTEFTSKEWVRSGNSPTVVTTLQQERKNAAGDARYYLKGWSSNGVIYSPAEIAAMKITKLTEFWGVWTHDYRVIYYKADNKSVLSDQWVTAGTRPTEVTAQAVSGKTFVSWLKGSTTGTAIGPVSGNITEPTKYYPRYLSNAFVGANSDGFVYNRTVTRFIPDGYTAATIPDSHHQYQIKIQFYYYGKEPTGPIKVVENLNGVFTTALGTDAQGNRIFFNDEYAKMGIKKSTVNVYRESYTGNGTFDKPVYLGAGNNGYGWEDMYINYDSYATDAKITNPVYYAPSEGNPQARKYEFLTLRFFDDSLDHMNGSGTFKDCDSAFYRKRAPLNENGNGGYRYTIVIDLELKRNRTIGGNGIPISFSENLPTSAFDPLTNRRIMADTDKNTATHGIKFYNADCTKLLSTKSFTAKENVNVEILYDLTPHDYYMDLYDVLHEKNKVYYGLLTAMSNEQTEAGRRQNHISIYGKLFTHGNGPIFQWGVNSDEIPNTDCDKSRNSHVDLNYKITLKESHEGLDKTYPAGTTVYQTYCYQNDTFNVDESSTDWYKKVKIDFYKDHAIVITAVATPIQTTTDSFGRAPVGMKDGKIVGDTVVGESYFFSARYAVADYGLVTTVPLQGERQKSGDTPVYLYTPSVKSGSTNKSLSLTLTKPLAISQVSMAYSLFPTYTNRNAGNKSIRPMMTDIMKATYQTKIINPLKYRNIGVSDPKQTTVTRTVYILPATTVMYDQDVLTFLTKENGTPITDYTASNSPWKLTGDVYNGFQNSSTTVRYGYDNNLINYELSADHAKNGNNQLDFNGGSIYAHVDGSKDAKGNRINQNQYGQFTFTGTGFDIYSRTGESTGVLVAEIYNASGKKIQNILMDTYMKEFPVVSNPNHVTTTTMYDTLYQIPVIAYTAPSYGTYTVKFRAYYHEIFDHYYNYTETTPSALGSLRKAPSQLTEEEVRELMNWEEDVPMSLHLSTEEPDRRSTRGAESYKTDKGYDVYVDGIRIYNPLNKVKAHSYTPGATPTPIYSTDANAVSAAAHYIYGLAGEVNPGYINLNDLLLDGSNTDWCQNLYGDENLEGDYVAPDVEEFNDVTGVLFVTGQDSESDGHVGQEDVFTGIHLGMDGILYTEEENHLFTMKDSDQNGTLDKKQQITYNGEDVTLLIENGKISYYAGNLKLTAAQLSTAMEVSLDTIHITVDGKAYHMTDKDNDSIPETMVAETKPCTQPNVFYYDVFHYIYRTEEVETNGVVTYKQERVKHHGKDEVYYVIENNQAVYYAATRVLTAEEFYTLCGMVPNDIYIEADGLVYRLKDTDGNNLADSSEAVKYMDQQLRLVVNKDKPVYYAGSTKITVEEFLLACGDNTNFFRCVLKNNTYYVNQLTITVSSYKESPVKYDRREICYKMENGKKIYLLPSRKISDPEVYSACDQTVCFYNSKYEALGPANEIYLTNYNGIAFYLGKNIPTTAKVHISIKSITGTRLVLRAHHGTPDNHTWTKIIDSANSKHRGEMYYDFSNYLYRDSDGSCYLFLQHANTGYGGIASLTGLKLIGAGTATPKVNLRTLQLAQEFYKETPIDDGLTLKHSLDLASDIAVNYIVPNSLLEGTTDSWVQVELPVFEGENQISTTTVTLRPQVRGDLSYYTLDGLTAVHMNDTLQATLYVVREGEAFMSPVDTYSIATYAYSQLNKETGSQALKTLCAELLRYGSAAQDFKGYRTDSLANDRMTDTHLSYLSDLEAVTFGNTNRDLRDLESPTAIWKGKSLDLGSKVAVKFVFSLGGYEGSPDNLSLALSYTAIDGEEKSVRLEGAELYNESKGLYAFTFDGLLAAELRTVLRVQVMEGETPLSSTLEYSPDTYGNGKANPLGYLCKALFAYSDAAKAFFA